MKIYTRTGDDGETGLFGGGRVRKDHARVTAYGTVDELNAQLGWAVTAIADEGVRARIETFQHDLFAIGGHLSAPRRPDGSPHPHLPALPVDRVTEMEAWMDAADRELSPLEEFVIPGGTPGAAALHVARTVCRRAEREVVHLQAIDEFEPGVSVYLNRLSDLLFVLARLENHRAGVADVAWER